MAIRSSIPLAVRAAVHERDGQQCRICGKLVREGQRVHLDHIIPLLHQGPTEVWNLRVSHSICNLRRTYRFPCAAQFVLPLSFTHLSTVAAAPTDKETLIPVTAEMQATEDANAFIEWTKAEHPHLSQDALEMLRQGLISRFMVSYGRAMRSGYILDYIVKTPKA